MVYIPAVNLERSRAFDACVGQLEQDLNTDTVASALGEQATREFIDITSRLEPASVKHNVVSMGRRARRAGKVALAFLTDDEANGFHLAPSLKLSMLPEQRAHYEEPPLTDKLINQIFLLLLQLITSYVPSRPLACGNKLYYTLDDKNAATIAALSNTTQETLNSSQEYRGAYRPSIIMRLEDFKQFPRSSANILLHEERHVVQACRPPRLLPMPPESQATLRDQVEAYYHQALYELAVDLDSAAWLDDMRNELGIPVIGSDEPFDTYEPLAAWLNQEGISYTYDHDGHDMDLCCVRSMVELHLPPQIARLANRLVNRLLA